MISAGVQEIKLMHLSPDSIKLPVEIFDRRGVTLFEFVRQKSVMECSLNLESFDPSPLIKPSDLNNVHYHTSIIISHSRLSKTMDSRVSIFDDWNRVPFRSPSPPTLLDHDSLDRNESRNYPEISEIHRGLTGRAVCRFDVTNSRKSGNEEPPQIRNWLNYLLTFLISLRPIAHTRMRS